MDKKHGHGVYTWADGRKYDGMWENGKQHGEGKYIMADKTERLGEWNEGKRVRWIDNIEGNEQDGDKAIS
jgi:hypothetical protein